ncbi:speckle targeted PIP5K1A-regulated poly(A) polymerase [Serinus canaria]|uniref:speckle targeted PIP5K1A-regulated poly(A) polymerase n=1 Tax=Serinus canaria TaxID=9135 RepID=UPI0021CC6ED5|nr:speckle targeted PIP5K1A-regulated poly(A) polymerase [Serinus canaria]
MEPEPGPGPDPDPGLDPDMDPGPDLVAGPGHDPGTGPVPVAEPVTDPANDPDVEPLHRGGFRCRLCQITTANLPSLLSHLSGKRHRRLRCLRAERRAQAQRSLFVSGFARGTAPERLRRHFRAFGPVATVVMDKEKGAFAIVELRDPAGRQRALEEPRHLLGGRRLRVRPREHRDWPRDPPRDPPGTPPAPPGLLQALGRAQDVAAQLQLLVAALELSAAERRLRELLVSLVREVFTEFFPGCSVVPYGSSVNGFDVHGCDLDLHLELGDPQGQETPNGDPQIPETPNGDPQIPTTRNEDPQSLRTPNGDPQIPETPNEDPQIPETPNGDPQIPATPNGDPQIPETPNEDPQIQRPQTGTPRVGSLLGGGGSLLGRGAPPEQVLALVGAVLRRCVPGVRRVRAVPGARRPVVKFSHKQSGLAGDVCLDNRLALFNTRFLRLCADADPRVRPLGYALRLWAGRQRLAGNRAGGGPLLTNYALTLLLVLFLQSRSPPVLPSVRRLRLLAGPQDRAQVGGWDCSFPRDVAALEPSGNGQSAASLLAEFFSYFGTLDLGGLLLSPLEGRALPRPPPESLGGLRPGPLTLQDPFELSHNVAANVTARTVSRFVRCCRDAARLCRGPEFLQKSRRGRPWGVMRLLQPGNAEGSPGKFLIPVPLRPPVGIGGVPQRQVSAALGFVLREVLGCGCEPEGAAGDTGTAEEPPPGAQCHLGRGTGGSRGEFGDTGTAGGPPPGAQCHLGRGTGGSRGEFGDAGTPGPGSKRRLSEGVPDGAGVPPAKRPRGPASPSRWSCCVWYRVWRGRRRLRRRLRSRGGSGGAPGTGENRGDQGLEGPGGAPDPGGAQGPGGPGGVQDFGGSPLALERAVTEAIVRGDTGTPPGPPPEPLLRFQLSARPGGSRRDPQMLLQLQPDPPSPLFQEFFHFLRSFLPEMVRQRLGWGRAGGAEPPGEGEFVNPEVLQ